MDENETYHGTRGHSGGDASRDAAYADLVHGITNKTQRLVLILAHQAGRKGVTVAELREKSGSLHHGRISSALTKQHIAGKLVALTERRNHCGIYVLPEFVDGREARPYRRQNKRLDRDDLVAIIHQHRVLPAGRTWYCTARDWEGEWTKDHRDHLADVIAEALR